EQGERDEGVGGEKVQGHGPVAGVGDHLFQRPSPRGSQRAGEILVLGIGDVLPHSRAQRHWRVAGVPLEPAGQFAQEPLPPPSQAETSSGVAARAAGSLPGSPAPAEAKCGRPPPFPPLSAAIRLTRSPALRPALTRSSVRVTWIAPFPPVLNRTSTALRLPSRNRSAISPTSARSSLAVSAIVTSTSPTRAT